jgi:hypothetical protein
MQYKNISIIEIKTLIKAFIVKTFIQKTTTSQELQPWATLHHSSTNSAEVGTDKHVLEHKVRRLRC